MNNQNWNWYGVLDPNWNRDWNWGGMAQNPQININEIIRENNNNNLMDIFEFFDQDRNRNPVQNEPYLDDDNNN